MNPRLKEGIRNLLPRSIKRHRILGGALHGSLIVTSWHDYPAAILGQTERPLLEYFASHVLKGETWLDVGAHYGYTAIALCKLVGPSGRVYAFEPMTNTAGCISRTRLFNQLTQLTVIPMGLANCDELAVESLHTTRGMIDSTLEDTAGFKETFLTSRLDWLWPKISGANPQIDGVKIDVQGMEIQVIEGMASLLKRYRPRLFVEIHKGVSRPQLLELIASLGYLPGGTAVDHLPAKSVAGYADDRSYLFTSAYADPNQR